MDWKDTEAGEWSLWGPFSLFHFRLSEKPRWRHAVHLNNYQIQIAILAMHVNQLYWVERKVDVGQM